MNNLIQSLKDIIDTIDRLVHNADEARSNREIVLAICELLDTLPAQASKDAEAGELPTYDRTVLESCAHWLDSHSSAPWAEKFGHRNLMQGYAADLRAALARSPVQVDAEAGELPRPDYIASDDNGVIGKYYSERTFRAAIARQSAPSSAVPEGSTITNAYIEAVWNSLDGKALIAGENQLNWNAKIRQAFARAILAAAPTTATSSKASAEDWTEADRREDEHLRSLEQDDHTAMLGKASAPAGSIADDREFTRLAENWASQSRFVYAPESWKSLCAYIDARPASGMVAAPEDPMEWPLPCDVTVGAGTIKKGCTLRTLVARMGVMNDMIREGWSSATPAAPDMSVRDALQGCVTLLERLDTIRHIAPDFEVLDKARAALRSAPK